MSLPCAVVALCVFQGGALGRAQSAATASSRAVARQLGEQGITAFLADDMASASDKLERAFSLYPTPTLALWSARTLVRNGHWVEAAERYREALRSSTESGNAATQKQAQRDATRELESLTTRIPTLALTLEGATPASVSISIDGAAVPSAIVGVSWPTDPGTHQLVVVRGRERRELTLQFEERERKQSTVRFEAQAPAAAGGSTREPAAHTPQLSPPPLPAGRLWRAAPQHGLQVIPLAGAAGRLVVPQLNGRPSSDGASVVYATTTRDAVQNLPLSELVVADSSTGKTLYSARIIGTLGDLRPCPRNKRYVLTRFRSNESTSSAWDYQLYDVKANKLLWQRPAADLLDWLPDGRLLSLSTSGVLSVDGAKAVQLALPSGFYPTSFSVNRRGTRLALQLTRSDGTREQDIWLANVDGSGLVRLTQTTRGSHPAWSPDDRFVAFEMDSAPQSSTGTASTSCQLRFAPVSAYEVTISTALSFQLDPSRKLQPSCSLIAWTD